MNKIIFPFPLLLEANPTDWETHSFKNFIFDDFILEVVNWTNDYGETMDSSYVVRFNNSVAENLSSNGIIDKYAPHVIWENGDEPAEPLLYFEIYNNNDYMGTWTYFVRDSCYPRGSFVGFNKITEQRIPIDETIERWLRRVFSALLYSMMYIMSYPRNHKQVTHKSSHKYKYSREHRLSTESNKIWLLDDIVNYVAEKYVPEGGHREIMCPCWEVRGHYRHLKSGKVIFIRPFKKGKERTTAEPKTHEYYLDKSMQ